MTERNCGNCRHFVKIEGATTGHCTNPLVVSHQGRLVMYRAGEIGCRRGWKQDLWEAEDESGEPRAAAGMLTPNSQKDYGRAAAWADSAPARPDSLSDILPASQSLDDDDLLDPRRTRDIREAMRRAREAKKREQVAASRREPFDQPILNRDEVAGEDTLLHVASAPVDHTPPPLVSPVSADEVRQRVDEMRQPRHYNDPPPSIHFDRYDDHFSEREDAPVIPSVPESSRQLRRNESTSVDAEPITFDEPDVPERVETDPYADSDYELRMESRARAEVGFDDDLYEETAWPEQAPWAGEDTYDPQWQEERPKRRSWIGSLLHRQPRPPRVDPREGMFAWEPELEQLDPGEYDRPLAAESGAASTAGDFATDERVSSPGHGVLPPLPSRDDDELHDDYLLADGNFADAEEEDLSLRGIEHICATCRYFRADGTCGNAFAFTFRRRVSEEYLSCASSIGAWWLPSDHYWESVVNFSHHGQPTPLLERYEIGARASDNDEDIRTPQG